MEVILLCVPELRFETWFKGICYCSLSKYQNLEPSRWRESWSTDWPSRQQNVFHFGLGASGCIPKVHTMPFLQKVAVPYLWNILVHEDWKAGKAWNWWTYSPPLSAFHQGLSKHPGNMSDRNDVSGSSDMWRSEYLLKWAIKWHVRVPPSVL